ncbi:hypothetical protein [Promicromonospora sp. NFX87]|uniref:hypothetical protein n=1 Tax=Promicromonospora sp. NFX87 TaxID=3402691 RepID=UPI003AFAC6BE
MTVEIHRAQFVREGSASSSGGEVRYYEGEAGAERLRDDVLYAFLNQVVDNTRGTSLARTWLGERVYPRLSKVVKVQRLVDGEWVELEVDLVLPDVVLTAPSVPWPFKPGDVVDDAEGAVEEWLEAAPEQTVVFDPRGDEWARRLDVGWVRPNAFVDCTSSTLATSGPLTVVSVGKEA